MKAIRGVWRMSRPTQVALVVVVFAVGVAAGAAMAGSPDWTAVAWAAGALVPVAVSVHVINEYADAETDALTHRTTFSGGSGALSDLGMSRRTAWRAAVAAAVVSGAVVAVGLGTGGLTAVAAGLLAIGLVGGWQYSVGPLRMSRRGLGEVGNAVLGGLLLPVYGAAAATGRVSAAAVLMFLPFALFDFVNLLETQWADREADHFVAKHTLVTRISPGAVRTLAVLATVAAYVVLFAAANELMVVAVALATLAALPFSVWALVRITRVDRPLPGVLAMVTSIVVQGVAWTAIAVM